MAYPRKVFFLSFPRKGTETRIKLEGDGTRCGFVFFLSFPRKGTETSWPYRPLRQIPRFFLSFPRKGTETFVVQAGQGDSPQFFSYLFPARGRKLGGFSPYLDPKSLGFFPIFSPQGDGNLCRLVMVLFPSSDVFSYLFPARGRKHDIYLKL